MGRSKEAPSFFLPAGARFTVIFLDGRVKPVFPMADWTRSRDSLTALSGRPTMVKEGRPFARSTSTSTWNASIPMSPTLLVHASMVTSHGNSNRHDRAFFYPLTLTLQIRSPWRMESTTL